MTTLDRLPHSSRTGVITDVRYHILAALIRRERFSVPDA
jgi:hypothetical protein